MNPTFDRIPTAAMLAAIALISPHSMAGVKDWTLPGCPSAALDRAVAHDVLKQAGLVATLVKNGIGDDDGVSLKELDRTLARDCDVIAGFPRSALM